MSYTAAKAQCESDGSMLAIPRSEAENTFIANLVPNENLWIGINDIAREGIFVSVDGRDISYTKWLAGEPNNNYGDEDGVEILGDRGVTEWNDEKVTNTRKFVCSVDIAGRFHP